MGIPEVSISETMGYQICILGIPAFDTSKDRLKYPSIRKKLWGGALWSPSYFAGSYGGAPISIIRQYIEQQQTPSCVKASFARRALHPRPEGRSFPRNKDKPTNPHIYLYNHSAPTRPCAQRANPMSILRSIAPIAFGLLFLSPPGLTAQDLPDKFTNLQTLPKNISRQDLVAAMRGYALSLGVRCPFCHAAGPTPGSMDFASDDKAPKRTARIMLRMTDDINRNYIAGVAQPPPTVECVTCHRGSANPRTLEAILSETLEQSGLAATVTQYRQLRKENYGNGKYDFSEATINLMSESLLKKSKAKEAVGMMELNAEVNPLTRWGYGVLAMAHQANQESEKAELDFEKILELDPHDAWASGQLKSIRAAREPK
jgi:hypothetical protein